MLRLIDRYLLRELLTSLGAVTAIVLLVALGGTLSITLDRMVRGRIPASLLWSQLALRSLDALPLLLPLALFLAILLAYSRLYRDSEMLVLSASGFSAAALLRPVLWLAAPLSLGLAALSFWVAPLALQWSDRMIDAANRSLLVAGMEPGRFIELPGRQAVIYVANMSPDGTRFSRVFLWEEDERGRMGVTTAREGTLFQDRAQGERYVSLQDGFRIEGAPGQLDYRMMRYARNDIRLPEPARDEERRAEKRASMRDLYRSGNRTERAEFHWRLGLPISALLLSLLAVPLSRSVPREPRYGKILLAIAAYVLYTNVLGLGRGWIAQGQLSHQLGLWWAHAGVLAVALWLLGADWRRARGAKP